ncbi:MAG: rubredoxin [Syntrophales bacterium]|nr:rubredoxin [Syntrophales bacterium]
MQDEPKASPPAKARRYVCSLCGYVYDPEKGDPDSGIAPGTPFENIPDGWVCPVCGAERDKFEPEK